MATPRSRALRKRRREQERWTVSLRTSRGEPRCVGARVLRARLVRRATNAPYWLVRPLRGSRELVAPEEGLFVKRSDAEAAAAAAVLRAR